MKSLYELGREGAHASQDARGYFVPVDVAYDFMVQMESDAEEPAEGYYDSYNAYTELPDYVPDAFKAGYNEVVTAAGLVPAIEGSSPTEPQPKQER